MKGYKILSYVAVAVALLLSCVVVAVCAYYPNKYSQELDEAAAHFNLDPALVRAVVWAESRFDRLAVSRAGAQGLMQLMPDTFEECANALDMKGANAFDVRSSLMCGCYYLANLIDKFGDVTAAIYAYNAGEANARRFLSGEEVFPETAAYVTAVNRALRFYGLFVRNRV